MKDLSQKISTVTARRMCIQFQIYIGKEILGFVFESFLQGRNIVCQAIVLQSRVVCHYPYSGSCAQISLTIIL